MGRRQPGCSLQKVQSPKETGCTIPEGSEQVLGSPKNIFSLERDSQSLLTSKALKPTDRRNVRSDVAGLDVSGGSFRRSCK